MSAPSPETAVLPMTWRQARQVVSNPADYAHLPPQDRQSLFAYAWSILKTVQAAKSTVIWSPPDHPGDAA